MKNFINPIKKTLVLGLFALFAVSCDKEEEVVTPPVVAKDIVDVALADARFSTLAKLLSDNGLVATLKGAGPFTVFAPTNDAFAKIDASKLTKDQLVAVLKSHVVSGKVAAADVKSGATPTVGSVAYLTKAGNDVYVNGNSKVIVADVQASNGIIHAIDNVIIPPSDPLVKIAQGNKDFTELVSLVLAADKSVLDALSNASENGYTVFAPTNAAFTELYKTLPKATLLLPATKKTLTDVLLYHVVPSRVFSSDLANVKGEVATANAAGKLTFDLTSGAVVKGKTSGASKITAVNILGTNGVIHVIDKVLLP